MYIVNTLGVSKPDGLNRIAKVAKVTDARWNKTSFIDNYITVNLNTRFI